MKAKIDGKAIKEKYENQKDRKKISLYLSEELYAEFKEACGAAPASRVMEELMRKFIISIRT